MDTAKKSSSQTDSLLNFISETQKGKYTDTIPEVTNISYNRLDIQEQIPFEAQDVENEYTVFLGFC